MQRRKCYRHVQTSRNPPYFEGSFCPDGGGRGQIGEEREFKVVWTAIQIIESSNNLPTWSMSAIICLLWPPSHREEEEGTEQETFKPCREEFLTSLNTARCQCHSCKHFASRRSSPFRISLLLFWRRLGHCVLRRSRFGREGKGREQPRCRPRVAEPHLRSWASL